MSKPIPHHIKRHIETKTGLPLGLAGGRAKPGNCPNCGHTIIAGYDSPLIAGLAITNPYRLTTQHEAAALIVGIPTWQLHNRPGNYTLTGRLHPGVPYPFTLKNADECVVVAKHECNQQPLSTEAIQLHPKAGDTFPDTIPF